MLARTAKKAARQLNYAKYSTITIYNSKIFKEYLVTLHPLYVMGI